ncbi:carotenoid ester lipase precursor [Lactarius indigo]|nr:carotenoid ester lipase precursor [Lactarius indigo]
MPLRTPIGWVVWDSSANFRGGVVTAPSAGLRCLDLKGRVRFGTTKLDIATANILPTSQHKIKKLQHNIFNLGLSLCQKKAATSNRMRVARGLKPFWIDQLFRTSESKKRLPILLPILPNPVRVDMVFLWASVLIICTATATILATPTIHPTSPIVTLDKGTFLGTMTGGVNKFLSIPFAKPPVGDLRFRLPKAFGPYVGKHNATAFGLSCPQQAGTLTVPDWSPQETIDYLSTPPGTIILDGEDCEETVVDAPCLTERNSDNSRSNNPPWKWIYGGAFEFGSSALYGHIYIVRRSFPGKLKKYTATMVHLPLEWIPSKINSLLAFGFLASQEVKDAKVGNLGLWDQRLAFRWVQKYIQAFGGDPSKVTICCQTGQQYYDYLVERTGCTGTSDTLACLRAAPYKELKVAMESTPSVFSYHTFIVANNPSNPHWQSVALVWQPRVDGVFLGDSRLELARQGKAARIPFVIGDCDDEGTLFSLSLTNVTTKAELRSYLSEFFFLGATDAQMDRLFTLYPQDVTKGSPYDSGTKNAFTPESKCIASILGDFEFQAPRRISKRLKSLPILGSVHGSDVPNIYGGGDLTDYLINFATNLDPNSSGLGPQWPRYTTSSRQLMTFVDGQATSRTITLDTYRGEAMKYLTKLLLANPL